MNGLVNALLRHLAATALGNYRPAAEIELRLAFSMTL
jgi:hypothetical protein